jgi:hypothetical protein
MGVVPWPPPPIGFKGRIIMGITGRPATAQGRIAPMPLPARRKGQLRPDCELCGKPATNGALVEGERILTCWSCYQAVDESGAVPERPRPSRAQKRRLARLGLWYHRS